MKVSDLKVGYLYKDYDKRGHCRNGTFEVKVENETIKIRDTYWSDSWFAPSNDYCEDFEEVLKLDDYNRTGWKTAYEYNEDDYIQVHFTQLSGRSGYEYTNFFVKKSARKNKSMKIEELEEAIKQTERHLELNKISLEELRSGKLEVEQVMIY